jgi:hypothetical protein
MRARPAVRFALQSARYACSHCDNSADTVPEILTGGRIALPMWLGRMGGIEGLAVASDASNVAAPIEY